MDDKPYEHPISAQLRQWAMNVDGNPDILDLALKAAGHLDAAHLTINSLAGLEDMLAGEKLTHYRRADGEPIAGLFDWTGDAEWFDEDESWEPVKLIRRTVLVIEEVETTWYPPHWHERCASCDGKGTFTNVAGYDEECNGEGSNERDRPDDHLK